MSVQVIAPSRLHFGLIHVPLPGLTHWPDGTEIRNFGGLGLMLASPTVQVTASQHYGSFRATGNLAERALEFAELLRQRCFEYFDHELRVELIANGPPQHVGLGVGTALALATCDAMVQTLVPWRDSTSFLAWATQRGQRSGIGITGYDLGGFIVDDGKISDIQLPSLYDRTDFPQDWRIVLVRPPVEPIWHGQKEREAFLGARDVLQAQQTSFALRKLAHETILTSVYAEDFRTFSESIAEFNRLAGEPFQNAQGGIYASPEIACVIDDLMDMGTAGVGQSSWGPTVFAFAESEDQAHFIAKCARDRFSSETEIQVTQANNTGAESVKSDG